MSPAVRLGLEVDPEGAAEEVEIVHVKRPEGALQRGENRVDRHSEPFGLLAIELGPHLRHIGAEGGGKTNQLLALPGCRQHRLGCRFEFLEGAAGARLHKTFKTAGRRQAVDRRRIDRQDEGILDPRAGPEEITHQVERRTAGTLAVFEILERDETHTRIRTVRKRQHVETRKRHHLRRCRVGRRRLIELIHHLFRTRQRRRIRQDRRRQHPALILFRRQRAGQHAEELPGAADHRQNQQRRQHPVAQEKLYAAGINAGGAEETAVPPIKKAVRTFVFVFEQQRTQRRCQRQRHKTRDHHRHRDGHRELTVHLADQTAEERDRHKNRAQYQHDGDHRSGHFFHRLDGCEAWRKPFFAHDAFDVFEHHDGVVDHDADGQHHAEQRQGIDRKTERVHAGKSAHQRNRHRQRRDQRRSPILQEEENHQENQGHGFEQGFDHLDDRNPDEFGGIERNGISHPGREPCRQVRQAFFHFIGRIERVGARLQENADRHRGFAVPFGRKVVIARAELDPGHILQPHDGAVVRRPDDDFFEFLRRFEATARGHRIGEIHVFELGFGADAAGRKLRILLADRRRQIRRRQAQPRHGIRPHPHADRIILGAEDLRVAHAGDTFQLIEYVDQRVIRQENRVAALIGRIERDDRQELRRLLEHRHPQPPHLFGQQRQRRLHPIVHVDRREVRIGPHLEGHRDRQRTIAGRGRTYIKHVLHTVDLLFERCRHGFGHHLGAGAGVKGRHLHFRRQDVGKLGDRQISNRSEPGDQDHR